MLVSELLYADDSVCANISHSTSNAFVKLDILIVFNYFFLGGMIDKVTQCADLIPIEVNR